MIQIQNRLQLITEVKQGREFDFLFFWSHKSQADIIDKSCLSQWYPAKFIAKEATYFSAEQYMMAKKAALFRDTKKLHEILKTEAPYFAKRAGRLVQNFDPLIWDRRKFDFVVEGNFHKFSQNQRLREFLLGTGDKILVEASPYDKIWGIGMRESDPFVTHPVCWRGDNLLGFALMTVREMLWKL